MLPHLRAGERFWALDLDEDLADRFGLPPLDRDLKAKILGANYAAMVGLDLDTAIAAVADDEWARRRADGPVRAPYSAWAEARGEDHAAALAVEPALGPPP